MARAPERGTDPTELSDDELYELITEHLKGHSGLDAEWISVTVKDGHVSLEGGVGTDGEVQIAEKVVHDVLGVDSYTNDLVVDHLHREENDLDEEEDDDMDTHQSDTADHLGNNHLKESYDTDDAQEATERGMPYVPPEDPTPDGYRNGEQH